MAVVGSNLTKGSLVASQSTFPTASVTPTGNNLILIAVATRTASGAPNDPTITGNGLTWVKIDSNIYDDTGSQRKVSVFRAMGASPSAGAITIDFAGQNQSSCDWSVEQFSGVDTSGTNGSGAIVQEVPGNGGSQVGVTSLTLTLAALGSANNVAFGGFGAGNGASITLSVGTGFTQLGNVVDSGPENGVITEYKLNATSVVANVSPSNFMGGVAIEIKASTTPVTAYLPKYDHVIVILMENSDYGEVIGNMKDCPYINNTLIPISSSLTNMGGLDHPSLGNYLALLSGSTQGQDNGTDPNVGPPDHLALLNVTNLVDRLEGASVSWKAYMEAMPSDWYTRTSRTMGDTGGNDNDANPLYQEHHNPFVYFQSNNDTNANSRLTKIVPYTQFATDLAVAGGGGVPQFSFITPQMDHDMHDTQAGGINRYKAGDTFLSGLIGSILTSDAYTKQKTMVILTWDESDTASPNIVPTLIFGTNIKRNYRTSTSYNHYNTLRTIEESLGGLATMTTNDATSTVFTDVFISIYATGNRASQPIIINSVVMV